MSVLSTLVCILAEQAQNLKAENTFEGYLLDAIITSDEYIEHAVLDNVEVVAIVALPDHVLAGLGAFLEHGIQHLQTDIIRDSFS